jgi:radical SAM superfamily enzyme YgiQ (UPF0313 family)
MRVQILSLNRDRFVHRVAPIGPLHLAAALREKGHEVGLVDLMFSDDPERDLVDAVAAFRPELLGVAIRNVDSLLGKDEYRIPELKRYVEAVRKVSTAPMIAGGPGFSLFPEELVAEFGFEYGLVGEADRSLPALVDAIASGADPSAIPGLVLRRDGRFVSNPPDIVEDLDAIPFQAVDLIPAGLYAARRGNLAVFTRKACPLDCIYCPEAALHGQKVRLRSAKRVVDELEFIVATTGVRDFDFADTTFNVPREHALAVCEEIVRRGLRIRFEVELSPLDQDAESVRLLRRAGCIGVDLTADSGSDRMLGVLNKGFTADQIHRGANRDDVCPAWSAGQTKVTQRLYPMRM